MRDYDRLAGKNVSIVPSSDIDMYDLVANGEIIATAKYAHDLSKLAFSMGAKTVSHDYDMSIFAYNKIDMT